MFFGGLSPVARGGGVGTASAGGTPHVTTPHIRTDMHARAGERAPARAREVRVRLAVEETSPAVHGARGDGIVHGSITN